MADLIVVTLALAIIALILVYQYLTWHYNLWNRLGLAGPRPRIVFGNFPSVVTGKRSLLDDIDDIYNAYKKSHTVVGVFMTRNPEILLLDPKLAHEVMVTNFTKFRDNLASKWAIDKEEKFAPRNPFLVAGDEWKSKRADALGGLTLNKLNLAYPIWKESAQKLSQFLKERTTKGHAVLESKDLAFRYTTNVMADLLWGIDAGTFTHSTEPNTIQQNAQQMLRHTFQTVVLYYSCSLLPFMKRFFDHRFFPAETDRFFSQLTKDAVAMRLKDGRADRTDYLNYLLQLQERKGLSHDDVVGHILTVLLDGYETSANAIYHTLFYLAKYESAQEKLRAEILANVEPDGYINFETLNSLPYLDQCMHETLRLITPIPIFSRICTDSTSLEMEPHKRVPIRAGTIVTVPIYSFHHDPDYFPEPYKYKPERFDNAAHTELIKRGIFMPFGDGPRICLGMRTGQLQVKSFLVQLLQEYRISCCSQTLDEKKPDSNTFILGLDGDIWLQYEKL